MGYSNEDTWQVAVWIENDGAFLPAACRHAAKGGAGAVEKYLSELLRYQSDDGRPVRNPDDRENLAGLRDSVAMNNVNWSEITEALLEVEA